MIVKYIYIICINTRSQILVCTCACELEHSRFACINCLISERWLLIWRLQLLVNYILNVLHQRALPTNRQKTLWSFNSSEGLAKPDQVLAFAVHMEPIQEYGPTHMKYSAFIVYNVACKRIYFVVCIMFNANVYSFPSSSRNNMVRTVHRTTVYCASNMVHKVGRQCITLISRSLSVWN